MYTYFLVLNDYGIRPSTLLHLANYVQPPPNETDIYNPLQSTMTDIFDENGVLTH